MKKTLKFSILSLTILFSIIGFSQKPTIGLRFIDSNVTEGYTLFTPESINKVFLINNCGEIINEWEFTERPGATCYLLENGNLLRAGKESIEIRDWDNNIVWTFLMDSLGLNQHHDIEPMPNGNILCVITDLYPASDVVAIGRNPENLDENFKLDKIIELQPVGTNAANVIWEWKFIDHFIQDFDSSKLNYGNVANHPELIDINFDNGHNNDYTHVNAIDYNASLDQILISTRHLDEIHIIDHSTTTEEAKGSTGGNFNKGGDILWRWGNVEVYKHGTALDQKLYLQHDAKWVEDGYLDEGKITVFNNGGDGTDSFSSIHLLEPKILNNSYVIENEVFLPLNYEWSWNGLILEEVVKEGKKSGAHALPNGNFIICETSKGQVSEISRNGDVLWVYKNPVGVEVINQFEVSIGNNTNLFRAEKYSIGYVGFLGLDLTPKNIIEDVNEISALCIENNTIEVVNEDVPVVSNPIKNGIMMFIQNININSITISDSTGRKVFEHDNFSGESLEINLESGIYFVQFKIEGEIKNQKILII